MATPNPINPQEIITQIVNLLAVVEQAQHYSDRLGAIEKSLKDLHSAYKRELVLLQSLVQQLEINRQGQEALNANVQSVIDLMTTAGLLPDQAPSSST